MAEKQKQLVNRGRVAALVFLVLLLLLLVFLLWWWFFRDTSTEVIEQPTVNTNSVVLPRQGTPVTEPNAIPEVTPPSDGELQIMTLARNFTERYGTYSNQGDFQNLKELYQWSTTSLQQEFNSVIATTQPTSGYFGIETKVINISIDSQSASAAEVTVMTQRVQTGSSAQAVVPGDGIDVVLSETQAPQVDPNATSVRYQALTLSMVSIDDFWYVDSVTWQ